jgi:uridylate kinase
MAEYFFAETAANANVSSAGQWTPTRSTDLAAAKRAASRAQTFQGTTLYIAVREADGSFRRVAVKRADAINMNRRGSWESDVNV